jgi:hypothetical protein
MTNFAPKGEGARRKLADQPDISLTDPEDRTRHNGFH